MNVEAAGCKNRQVADEKQGIKFTYYNTFLVQCAKVGPMESY